MPLVHRKDYRFIAGVSTPCGTLACLGFQPEEPCVLFQLSQGDEPPLFLTAVPGNGGIKWTWQEHEQLAGWSELPVSVSAERAEALLHAACGFALHYVRENRVSAGDRTPEELEAVLLKCLGISGDGAAHD